VGDGQIDLTRADPGQRLVGLHLGEVQLDVGVPAPERSQGRDDEAGAGGGERGNPYRAGAQPCHVAGRTSRLGERGQHRFGVLGENAAGLGRPDTARGSFEQRVAAGDGATISGRRAYLTGFLTNLSNREVGAARDA
jgi:hypothetical protein